MANIKFSAFSAGGSGDTATARVVGFKNGDISSNLLGSSNSDYKASTWKQRIQARKMAKKTRI